jgi:hypothetical protein
MVWKANYFQLKTHQDPWNSWEHKGCMSVIKLSEITIETITELPFVMQVILNYCRGVRGL